MYLGFVINSHLTRPGRARTRAQPLCRDFGVEVILHELAWLTWISDLGNVMTVERSGKLTQMPSTSYNSACLGNLASTRLVVPNLDFIMVCKRSEADGKILSYME